MTQTLDRRSQPELATAIESALECLTHLPPGHHTVVSCYGRLGPADRTPARYLLTWKARAKEALAGATEADLTRPDRLALERDIDRLVGRFFLLSADSTEELPGAYTRSGRGGKYHSDRNEAVEDALREGVRVTVVSRGITPTPMDGLAATLRFR